MKAKARFDYPLGSVDQWTKLKTFIAYYRFKGRTWSIRVWASNSAESNSYCKDHHMRNTGELVDEV